jgi:chitin deacetylase
MAAVALAVALVFVFEATGADILPGGRSADPAAEQTSADQLIEPPAPEASEAPPEPVVEDWTIPERYSGQVIRRRLRTFEPKLLALTFDDGPDPKVTPRILESLRKHNARATFFVLGSRAARHPELMKEIADQGHAIGSHTATHLKKPSAARAVKELDWTESVIAETTGRRTSIFRPPYGILNNQTTAEAIRRGMAVFLWTISSADTKKIGAEAIASNVINTPNPGDIVLMHDGSGHGDTAVAVEKILSKLSTSGYTFVTLPELLSAWDEKKRVDEAAAEAARLTP